VIRAVLDTNIIVSGMIVPQGVPFRLIEAARSQHFALVTSTVLVTEVLRTLARDRIRRKYHIGQDDLIRLRELLERETVMTILTDQVSGVATHPEDDLILATAISGRADYLVTGDRQLQRLGSYCNVSIVSPRDFLTILRAEPSR
jgi:putative PIN family toxin of toxin-antitoxin system